MGKIEERGVPEGDFKDTVALRLLSLPLVSLDARQRVDVVLDPSLVALVDRVFGCDKNVKVDQEENEEGDPDRYRKHVDLVEKRLRLDAQVDEAARPLLVVDYGLREQVVNGFAHGERDI